MDENVKINNREKLDSTAEDYHYSSRAKKKSSNNDRFWVAIVATIKGYIQTAVRSTRLRRHNYNYWSILRFPWTTSWKNRIQLFRRIRWIYLCLTHSYFGIQRYSTIYNTSRVCWCFYYCIAVLHCRRNGENIDTRVTYSECLIV